MPVFAHRSFVSLLAGDVCTSIMPSPPSAFVVDNMDTSNVRDLNNLFAAFSDNENMCSGS